jgi:hypothetical protein
VALVWRATAKKLDALKESWQDAADLEAKANQLKKKDLDKQRGDDISRTLEKGLQKEEETKTLLKIEEK